MSLLKRFLSLFESKPLVVIIDGLKYDFGTSSEVWSYVQTWGDMYYGGDYRETLYKTENGRYFKYGDVNRSDMKVTPMTENEARNWCQEHAPVWKYEEQFGEVQRA